MDVPWWSDMKTERDRVNSHAFYALVNLGQSSGTKESKMLSGTDKIEPHFVLIKPSKVDVTD